MRRIEFKVCKKCGKAYLWESGGIVSSPADFMDYGMCPACRGKALGKIIKMIR